MTEPAAYAPPRFGESVDLDLSRNEGSRPGADLLYSLDAPESLMRSYPDVAALTGAIAESHGVTPDQVLVTAGSDDGLFRCMLSIARAGRSVVTTYPSFEMIPVYAAQLGITVKELAWWSGKLRVDRLLSLITGETGAVVLVSPNNPTGSVIDEEVLRSVSVAAPLVVLDSAYAEYADLDLTQFALSLGNVLVSRTFSKAWGLAGLRVGYLLGSSADIARMGRFGSPFSVSGLSASVARARLATGQIDTYLEQVRANRRDLIDGLGTLRARPLQSQANFVLAEVKDPGWVVAAASSLGVGLRRFPGRLGLERFVRITVPGVGEEYRRLCRVLQSALAPEAILFDLDGVLADVSRSQTRAIIETAASFGARLSLSQVVEARLAGNANDDWELTRRLCKASGVAVRIEEVTRVYESLYQGRNGRTGFKEAEKPLVDPELLKRWSKRFRLGVVTGRPREDAEEFLHRFGLRSAISTVVAREDAPLKPDPAPVELAMGRLGAQYAWMLGDTPDDIAAAKRAGAVPIGVVSTETPIDAVSGALAGAARILRFPAELEEMLG